MDGLAGKGGGKAGKAASKAAKVAKGIDGAKKAIGPLPEGTVLTKMHGRDGNVVTGVNSKARQGLMKEQFGLSKKQAKQQSKDMPIALRDAHPNPPVPRNGGACAEHHAANKLNRVKDTPADTYTVTKTAGGKIKPMERCTNCRKYDGLMGEVVTDSKHPRAKAWAPAAQAALEGVVMGTTTTSHDSAEVRGRSGKAKCVFLYSESCLAAGKKERCLCQSKLTSGPCNVCHL